jgi:hypothetical protein
MFNGYRHAIKFHRREAIFFRAAICENKEMQSRRLHARSRNSLRMACCGRECQTGYSDCFICHKACCNTL